MKIIDETFTHGAQGSAEWFQQRIGKLTASNMKAAIDFRKDGKEGADRIKLKMQIVAERMTDIIREVYVNDAMLHGQEQEPNAKLAYVEKTGVHIMPAPFIDHPVIEYFGASPDGFIGHDGLIEVKCPTTTTFLTWLKNGVVPDEHKPQMLAQIACTRRKWVEFVAFDPRIQKGPKLFIRRFEPELGEIQRIEQAAVDLLEEVDVMFDALVNGG